MAQEPKIDRKTMILGTLASMLETHVGKPITTANLAKEVGVSEAALYRHFPSKAKMFENLIDYIEDIIMTDINQMFQEETRSIARAYNILAIVFRLVESTPGIARILTGEALLGEHERLLEQVRKLLGRIEINLKNSFRERSQWEGDSYEVDVGVLANIIMAYIEGKLLQFTRSHFKALPSHNFEEQWTFFEKQLMAS